MQINEFEMTSEDSKISSMLRELWLSTLKGSNNFHLDLETYMLIGKVGSQLLGFGFIYEFLKWLMRRCKTTYSWSGDSGKGRKWQLSRELWSAVVLHLKPP